MTADDAAAFVASTAAGSGLVIEGDALANAAAEMAATVERGPDGTFAYAATEAGSGASFRIEGGQMVEVPVGAHIATVIRQHARPAPAKPRTAPTARDVPPAKSSAPGWTRGNPGEIAQIAREMAAAHDSAMAREVESWPNPWRKGKNYNRTNQQIIVNKNPALAAKYRSEAGA